MTLQTTAALAIPAGSVGSMSSLVWTAQTAEGHKLYGQTGQRELSLPSLKALAKGIAGEIFADDDSDPVAVTVLLRLAAGTFEAAGKSLGMVLVTKEG